MDSDFSLLADKPASRLFSTLYPGAGEDPCFSGQQQEEPEVAILWGSRSRRRNRLSAVQYRAWNLWGIPAVLSRLGYAPATHLPHAYGRIRRVLNPNPATPCDNP